MMPVMDDVQPMTFEVVPPIDCTDPEALSDWTAEGKLLDEVHTRDPPG